MAYVLDIRAPEGGDGEAVASGLEAGLGAHGEVTATGDGFDLVVGETRLRFVRTRDEGGRVDGVDVEIPYGALEAEVADAVGHVLTVAGDAGDRVFDPQLGRGVTAGEGAAVVASFVAASAYHVDYAGRIEDTRAGGLQADDPRRGQSRRLRLFLVIVGVLVIGYLGLQSCVIGPLTRALSPASTDDDALDGGPPPGWMAGHPTTLSPGSVTVPEAGDGGR